MFNSDSEILIQFFKQIINFIHKFIQINAFMSYKFCKKNFENENKNENKNEMKMRIKINKKRFFNNL